MQADDPGRIPASVGARPVPAPLAGGDLGGRGFPLEVGLEVRKQTCGGRP
jgi:hypothetical protein